MQLVCWNVKNFTAQPKQNLQIVASETTKLFFAGIAIFSKWITVKGPAQQNVLKHIQTIFCQ